MKRCQADQAQKSCKNNKACIVLSNCIAVGGGAI